MALFDVVAGWTGLLGPFTLLVDGVALNLTGFPTPEIILRNASGTLVTVAGTVAVSDAAAGKVTFSPAAADFTWDTAGPRFVQAHTIAWKVTDGAGKIVYFPNGEPNEINVYRA